MPKLTPPIAEEFLREMATQNIREAIGNCVAMSRILMDLIEVVIDNPPTVEERRWLHARVDVCRRNLRDAARLAGIPFPS